MRQILFGNKTGGISIIEALVSIGVLGVALLALLGFIAFSLEQSLIMKQTTQATALAEETMETIRNFRDNTTWSGGLGLLTNGIAYHAQKSISNPVQWQMIQGSETVNGFLRSAVFTQVLRDGNSNIVVSGGTQDVNTKKITVVVSWSERGRAHQVQLINYLTNWRK